MVSGLVPPDAFAMLILLAGLNSSCSFFSFKPVSSNHIGDMPSSVSEVDPAVIFPGLLLMLSYAIIKNTGRHRMSIKSLSMASCGKASALSLRLCNFFITLTSSSLTQRDGLSN